jgi:hypothetical protein
LLAPSTESRGFVPYVLDDGTERYLAAVRRALAAIESGNGKVVTAQGRIGNAPTARRVSPRSRNAGPTARLCTADGAFIAATPGALVRGRP